MTGDEISAEKATRAPNRIIPPLSPKDIARFWNKAQKGRPNKCWPWTANKLTSGYGRFCLGSQKDGSRGTFLAHRVAWVIAHGPIPAGMCVCHHCDVTGCQNPAHLFLGTQADNNHDKDRKGRGRPPRGDRNGSRTHPERRPRGEQISWVKLTEQDVLNIRAEYASGGTTLRALAQKRGIGKTQIWKIVHHKSWAHI